MTCGRRACAGKISYLPAGEQFGVPEAFGVQRAEAAFGVSRLDHRRRPITADPGFTDSQPHLSRATLTRTPSMVELDDLLRRRSRARGLGGAHHRGIAGAPAAALLRTRAHVARLSGRCGTTGRTRRPKAPSLWPACSSSPRARRPSLPCDSPTLVRALHARSAGKHARVVDAVQTRWNVLYASGSAASCTMKVTGSD